MADRMSREEYFRKKELDEARKNGQLPPEQDEEGNLINPHIPEFMSKAPWYLNQSGPGLKHQKKFKSEHTGDSIGLNVYYQRGTTGRRNTKFVKGACKNCGATTHTEKECVERPRKLGAWKTNKEIAPDEFLPQDLPLGFDGKRDRWNGYDPTAHSITIARYQKAEEERKKLKAAQREAQYAKNAAKEQGNGSESGESDDEGEVDEDVRLTDEAAAVGQEMRRISTKSKQSVRNLRIREDTAKYLRNLDPNSAFYDPKTHSMRENPTPYDEDSLYKGDNFIRQSGDSVKMLKAELMCWEAYNQGKDISLQSNPTQALLIEQQVADKKKAHADARKQEILSKYGGDEHLQSMPRELLLGSTEAMVHYTRDGRVANGKGRTKAHSKYQEDIHLGNHTSVWGSWFDVHTGRWGFACCYQTMRASYCTGEAGKRAAMEAAARLDVQAAEAYERVKRAEPADGSAARDFDAASRVWGENLQPQLDEQRLKEALSRQDSARGKHLDERKRKYNSLSSAHVTEEEMEAWRMKRSRGEDPMAAYVNDSD